MKNIYVVLGLCIGSVFAYAGDATPPADAVSKIAIVDSDSKHEEPPIEITEDLFEDVADVQLSKLERLWRKYRGSDQEKLELYKADRKSYLKQGKNLQAQQALENMQCLREIIRYKQAHDEKKFGAYTKFLQEVKQLQALQRDDLYGHSLVVQQDIKGQKEKMCRYALQHKILMEPSADLDEDIASIEQAAREYTTRIPVLYARIK